MLSKLRATSYIQKYQLLLALTIFAFCFLQHSITIFSIILAAYTIYLVAKKEMHFKINKLAIGFIALFLVYAIGIFFSDYTNEALHSLERKLVFLLFPLIFSFRFKENINFRPIIIGFISGVIICSILGLIHSFLNYRIHGDFNNSFGASVFSYIHHPTYFSAFLVISFLFAREGMKKKWQYFTPFSVTIYFLFTALMQFFCFSFAGMIFLFLVIVYLTYRLIWNKFPKYVFITSLIAFPLVPVVVYHSNIHIQIELDQSFSDIKSYCNNPHVVLKQADSYSGNQVRLILWTVSIQEFMEHPFGAGTANFDEKISARLMSYGLNSIADENYNAHNQFFQIAVEIGIIGIIVFIGLLIYLLYYSVKNKYSMLFFITLNLMFNCLFESMLQRESGIVFYGFWMILLYYWSNNNKIETKQS